MFGIYFGSIYFLKLLQKIFTSEGRFTSPPDAFFNGIEWLVGRGLKLADDARNRAPELPALHRII
jgi:hypothetical protein